MKRTIAIIGAGVTGLTLGKLLNHDNEVSLFERGSRPGGLIKCNIIDGSLFHTCGGHVFNTRNQKVLDFFWSLFNRNEEFHHSDRNSVVMMPDGVHIPYPIENHVYLLDDKCLQNIVSDIVALKRNHDKPSNFEDFLRRQFGDTLYHIYFEPYNKKIWKTDLKGIPLDWLKGKLPMPTIEEILFNNIRKVEEKKFVHSTFWYENEGGSQLIADRLADGLDIQYDSNITSLKYADGHWSVSGEKFDVVVFTGDVRSLPSLLSGVELGMYACKIERLKAHGTTAVFCEIAPNPYSWTYLPDSRYDAHRIICTGNFSPSNNAPGKMTATVEFTDAIKKDEILRQLEMIPLSPRYITHKFNPLTYPIQSPDTRQLIEHIKRQLSPYNLFLCGRFAEWEYFNMDKAMESAMDLAERIIKQ